MFCDVRSLRLLDRPALNSVRTSSPSTSRSCRGMNAKRPNCRTFPPTASCGYPPFFIVGAGISAPEIPIASEIIKKCKRKCKELDEISYIQFENETKVHENNPMKYYSEWIEFAYPNRIDRSNLFKGLNAKAKISSANLILAQILDSKKFANTVFTTNFDDSLKRALNLIGTKEFVSAENAMDNLVVNNHTKEIQIIYVSRGNPLPPVSSCLLSNFRVKLFQSAFGLVVIGHDSV